ncbi:MAG: Wzz/FepE/Etk N-terminal domain-containing protein [Anaerolineae bacterium]|jgi:uncharacterized protein involved in exopolysaccharide biosynthesis
MMGEEIDLRPYIVALLRGWYWILGLALVAAVAAFIVTSLRPPVYEASSVVLVTDPQYRMEFDSRFDTLERRPAYRLFPTLATSDRILESVVEAYTPSPQAGLETWRLKTLRGMVEAKSEGDPSLVVLTVRSLAARDAAAIANAWADALVAQGNEIYGSGETNLTFFQTQSAQAREVLDETDAALVEFEARNRLALLTARLEAMQQAQVDYLADQNKIDSILPDVSNLRDQILAQSAGDPVALADSVTALLLQIRAYNAEGDTPLQLEVRDEGVFLNQDPAQQAATLDDVVATLEARYAEIEGQLAELEPTILDLQRQIQSLETESERLQRQRQLAEETYMILARKVDEARIAAEEENGLLQVGSYASVPVAPVPGRRIFNAAAGGFMGLMVGGVLVLALALIKNRSDATPQ